MYTQAEILKLMRPLLEREGCVFQKNTNVFARPAQPGEVIETKTGDGLETTNAAGEEEYIVRNQTEAGEEYIVPADKFKQRYAYLQAADNGWAEYRSLGQIVAVELTPERLAELHLSGEFEFTAPWDDPMTAKAGDFMGGPDTLKEVYRIARKEFFETYKAVG